MTFLGASSTFLGWPKRLRDRRRRCRERPDQDDVCGVKPVEPTKNPEEEPITDDNT